jgi:hypothetical protein
MANFNNKLFIYGYLLLFIKIAAFPRKCVAFVDIFLQQRRAKKIFICNIL